MPPPTPGRSAVCPMSTTCCFTSSRKPTLIPLVPASDTEVTLEFSLTRSPWPCSLAEASLWLCRQKPSLGSCACHSSTNHLPPSRGNRSGAAHGGPTAGTSATILELQEPVCMWSPQGGSLCQHIGDKGGGATRGTGRLLPWGQCPPRPSIPAHGPRQSWLRTCCGAASLPDSPPSREPSA